MPILHHRKNLRFLHLNCQICCFLLRKPSYSPKRSWRRCGMMARAMKMHKKMEESKRKRELSYRRQKKDYDDRLKIEKADAEEKKKMRQLEREMEGIDDDEEEGRKGEENHGYAIHEVSCSCSILTSLLFLGLEKLGRSLRKLLNSSPTERRGVKNTMLDICR